MTTQPADENLSFEEKLVLYLLGGAGLLVWAVVMLFSAGFRGPGRPSHSIPLPLVQAPPTATNTVEVPPTATPTPWPTFTPTPGPTPTFTPTPTPMPYGATMLPIDGDIKVIALLGIDEKQEAPVWRTDSIILAFVDQKAGRLTLLSVPRDLWVHIPGYSDRRINTVDALGERTGYPGGGSALLDRTLRFNLGVPVHHYVRLDMMGFIRIVDALGGVTVDIKKPVTDYFPDRSSPSGWAWTTLPVGPRQMDGSTALAYCRSRMTSNDFARSARQQQVLFALWDKVLTVETLARASQLWEEFDESFDTDLSLKEAIQLAYFARSLQPDQIDSAHFDPRLARAWITPQGAQVLLPQTEEIRQEVLALVATGQ